MLVEWLDVRLLSNLAFTFRFNWRAGRIRWFPGLAATVGKLGILLLSMTLCHLGRPWSRILPWHSERGPLLWLKG